MSLIEDAATYNNCTGGPFPIFSVPNTCTANGEAMVKHLERVICPCGKDTVSANSTLFYAGVARQPMSAISVVGKVANAAVLAESPFDEQVSVAAYSVHHFAGLSYAIETDDGRITDGGVPQDSRLPRVFTNAEAAYTVYGEDEALSRMHAW